MRDRPLPKTNKPRYPPTLHHALMHNTAPQVNSSTLPGLTSMAEPLSELSPDKMNASITDDEFDMTFHDPPSSPFVSHVDHEDQENVAPSSAPTPMKPLFDLEDDVPQSAIKVSPQKKAGLREQGGSMKMSPVKNLMDDFEEVARISSPGKSLPERSGSALSIRSRKSPSPFHAPSTESSQRTPAIEQDSPEPLPTPSDRPTSSHEEHPLRENEGLTVAMKFIEEMRTERHEYLAEQRSQDDKYDLDLDGDNTEFNPDGRDFTSADIDDTSFSMFSEMPGMDMTRFNSLQKSPTKNGFLDACIAICFERCSTDSTTGHASRSRSDDTVNCPPHRAYTFTHTPPLIQGE